MVVSGVVTAFSGYKNSFFMQDSHFGISVDRTDHAKVHIGDLVEVTGTSNPGMFAPTIMASKVRVTGRSSLPNAHLKLFSDLLGGGEDSQWIELQGVIHAAKHQQLFGHDILRLTLSLGNQSVAILLQQFETLDTNHLVDATVRVHGVCSTSFNDKRQFVSAALIVPDQRDITIVDRVSDDPYAIPQVPVRSVLQFGQALHRVKITGVSTYQSVGHSLYLQQGDDGIQLRTSSKEQVGVGMKVEAVGFPVMGNYSPMLTDASYRLIGSRAPILPKHVEAEQIIGHATFSSIPYDQQLVELRGSVVEDHESGGNRLLVLHMGDHVFEAKGDETSLKQLKRVQAGSMLSVTGICDVHLDSDGAPSGFDILLRSPSDILVLKKASWWTLPRTFVVLGGFVALALVAALWVIALRSRVRRQTQTIRESECRFRELAQVDVLTKLPNRLMLEEHITRSLEHSKICDAKAAVFSIDIDHFKQINDHYGHHVGDECLRVVAERLRSRVRKVDLIARTGGEEFMQVTGCLADRESALKVANGILEFFIEPLSLAGHEIKITVSVGGAIYPDDGETVELLRKRSDLALYEAKRVGRNCVIFANERLDTSNDLTASIETALRHALQTRSFYLVYQPIVDSAGAICSFEALIRSSNLWLNELGPSKFVPVAESSGLIVEIGRWIFDEVCHQVVTFTLHGICECPIAMNISCRELLEKGFAEYILETFEQRSIPGGMLHFEVTETTMMYDPIRVKAVIDRLAAVGILFSIDDFGTGYSSLSRLHELSISQLKIDKSFTKDLLAGGGSYSIVSAIVQMAKSMHLRVVAEGVETEEQLRLLSTLGLDRFQGYLFEPAVKSDKLLHVLQQNQDQVATADHNQSFTEGPASSFS
ncbi:EAL domain-containing protein [Granulicella arctica]|uniref:EAL domain-containing protein n=1 Tax=Granulicella arctica TaxID=940613 RepID=UPI0021DFB343|nr:EAL domain-containing protein [Granulicella arctica]